MKLDNTWNSKLSYTLHNENYQNPLVLKTLHIYIYIYIKHNKRLSKIDLGTGNIFSSIMFSLRIQWLCDFTLYQVYWFIQSW